mgnify:CR=1 FL=1
MKIIKQYCQKQIMQDMLLKKIRKNAQDNQKLTKITLSIGCKDANTNMNKLLTSIYLLTIISGQKSIPTKARKSIANFKLRQGKLIGIKATLRGNKLYTFLEKFIAIVLPQMSTSKKIKYKNRRPTNQFNLGILDSMIFPELENQYNFVKKKQGMNLTFHTKDTQLNKNKLFFSGLKLKSH